MAVQEPYIAFGDTESIDIFTIVRLKELAQLYVNQQGDPKEIQIQAQWSRTRKPSYPLVTIMTTIDEYAPSSMADLVEEDPEGLFAAEFNDIEINLELQEYGLRQLARLRSFLYLNLKYGANPFSGKQWNKEFFDGGINLLKWDVGVPEQVNLDVEGALSIQPQTGKNLERTDVEILWMQNIAIQANAQLGVQFSPDNVGVILGVLPIVTPDESELMR